VDAETRAEQLEEYFYAVAPAMRRTAYLIVRDWHTAEDMVQATFAKLYVAWPRVRRDGLEVYARRVLVNTCLTHLRQNRRVLVTDAVPETVVEPPGPAWDLSGALGILPPQQRAVVALRFLDDLSVQQVADVLAIAPGTVKSQTSRALATLRNHLPLLAADEESAL
jgi:RNA polymerase sigma-70 factor (sigma-E family)